MFHFIPDYSEIKMIYKYIYKDKQNVKMSFMKKKLRTVLQSVEGQVIN